MKRVCLYVMAAIVAAAGAVGGRAQNPAGIPLGTLRAESLRTDAERGDTVRTDEVRGDTVRTDEVRGDTVVTDEVRGDTVRTDEGRGDTVLTDAVRGDTVRTDEVRGDTVVTDTVRVDAVRGNRGFINFVMRIIDAFDNVDSSYVERIGYNFTAMLQGTTNFEFYSVGVKDYVDRLTFAQHPDFRVGPYFGWRWLFLGYTFDVTHLGSKKKTSGQRFEFSIYTSMFGLDLIKRSTGNDFFIRDVVGLGEEAERFEGRDCSYINANLIGINAYYNFNHRRFSSPAVFSQSTIQRRSAGSWQVGASFTIHDVSFDYTALPPEMLAETGNNDEFSSLERVKYYNYSLNGGYAYNFVPARGWCIGLSLMPHVGYMYASAKTVVLQEEYSGNTGDSPFMRKMKDIFERDGCLNYGGTGRLGVVYNTGRWFVGAFGVVHNFNYRRNSIRFSNTFGNANVCVGFFFQKKKKKN